MSEIACKHVAHIIEMQDAAELAPLGRRTSWRIIL
jgi:hypothetical protein